MDEVWTKCGRIVDSVRTKFGRSVDEVWTNGRKQAMIIL